MSHHCIADQPGTGELTMSFHNWLQKVRSVLASSRGQRHHGRRASLRPAMHRPYLEILEDRCLLSFSPATSYPVGTLPDVATAADFNNDGRLDLATPNFHDDTATVLLGNGDGTFDPAPKSPVGPYPHSLAVGDFNNDGNLDLATAIYASSGGLDISTLLGNGDGTFAAGISQTFGDYPA